MNSILVESNDFKYASTWLATQIECGKTSGEIAPDLHRIILKTLDTGWGFLSPVVRKNIASEFFEKSVRYELNGVFPGLAFVRKEWFFTIALEELELRTKQLSLHEKNAPCRDGSAL